MFWIMIMSCYVFMVVEAYRRGWILAAWNGIKDGTKRALAPGQVGRPDYNKIARLERELGIGQPKEHSCERGGLDCGVGCSAPAVPEDDPAPGDYEEVRIQESPEPVRRIDYRKRLPVRQRTILRRHPDPPPRLPDPANPQTELKFHPMDDPRLWP